MRKADNLPPSCAVVTKSGSLNFLEPSGPVEACNGTALPFTYITMYGSLNVKFRASVVHIRFRYAFTSCVSSLLFFLIFILLYTVSATPYTPFLLRSPLRSGLLRNKQISERDVQSLKYERSLVLGLWRNRPSNNLFPTIKQNVTFMSYGAPVRTHSVAHTALLQHRTQFHSHAPFTLCHFGHPKLRITARASLRLIFSTSET